MTQRPFDDHVNALAAYLPDGELFQAKRLSNSNFRQLLRGLTHGLFTAQGYLRELAAEYPPDATTDTFLAEWESALSIPDGCFQGAGSLTERRRDVIVKLAALGLQTAEDFEYLAGVFGETITVIPGSEYTNYPTPVPPDDQKRYYIVIEYAVVPGAGFPYTFPFTFGSDDLRTLECLFSQLKPSNCRVLFRSNAPPPPPVGYLVQSQFDDLDQDDAGVLLSGTSGKLVLSET